MDGQGSCSFQCLCSNCLQEHQPYRWLLTSCLLKSLWNFEDENAIAPCKRWSLTAKFTSWVQIWACSQNQNGNQLCVVIAFLWCNVVMMKACVGMLLNALYCTILLHCTISKNKTIRHLYTHTREHKHTDNYSDSKAYSTPLNTSFDATKFWVVKVLYKIIAIMDKWLECCWQAQTQCHMSYTYIAKWYRAHRIFFLTQSSVLGVSILPWDSHSSIALAAVRLKLSLGIYREV